jgi:RecB family exonuclease
MDIVDADKDIMSISRFLTYMRCPALYKAIYIDRSIPRQFNIHAHVGSTVHKAHEILCNHLIDFEKIIEPIDMQEEINDYWDSKIGDVPDLMEEIIAQKTKADNLIKTYFSYFKKADLKPKHVEKRLTWYPQGYPFALVGIIDRVDQDGAICDLKTSGKSPPKSKATGKYYVPRKTGYDLQMDTYIMLAREVLNIDVPSGSFEYVVKLKTPKVVKVDYPVDEVHITSTLDLMANLYDSIQKGNFPPNRLGDFCNPTSCGNWSPCTGL